MAAAPVTSVDVALEDLQKWTNEHLTRDELIQSKQSFFERYGKVFPEDHFFDHWMHYFDCIHMFCDRYSSLNGLTPFEYWRLDAMKKISAENLTYSSKNLLGFEHSLFQVLHSSNSEVVLRDFFQHSNFKVKARAHEIFDLLKKGEIFQSFLVHFDGGCYLGRGLIHHPGVLAHSLKKSFGQKRIIDEQIRESILMRLSLTNLRHLQHKHVSPRDIYETALSNLVFA